MCLRPRIARAWRGVHAQVSLSLADIRSRVRLLFVPRTYMSTTSRAGVLLVGVLLVLVSCRPRDLSASHSQALGGATYGGDLDAGPPVSGADAWPVDAGLDGGFDAWP